MKKRAGDEGLVRLRRATEVRTYAFLEDGDFIIWDNRPLIHKGSKAKPGEKSRMYRIGIYDELPFYVGIEQ